MKIWCLKKKAEDKKSAAKKIGYLANEWMLLSFHTEGNIKLAKIMIMNVEKWN